MAKGERCHICEKPIPGQRGWYCTFPRKDGKPKTGMENIHLLCDTCIKKPLPEE